MALNNGNKPHTLFYVPGWYRFCAAKYVVIAAAVTAENCVFFLFLFRYDEFYIAACLNYRQFLSLLLITANHNLQIMFYAFLVPRLGLKPGPGLC